MIDTAQKNKLKIVIVADGHFRPDVGTISAYNGHMASYLQKKGFDVHVFASSKPVIRADGVTVHVPSIPDRVPTLIKRLLRQVWLGAKVFTTSSKPVFIVKYSHPFKPLFLGLILLRKQYIMNIFGDEYEKDQRPRALKKIWIRPYVWLNDALRGIIIRKAAAFITTRDLLKLAEDYGAEGFQFETHLTPLDFGIFNPARYARNKNEVFGVDSAEKKVVLFVGRLTEKNSINGLIESVKIINVKRSDFRLFLVGGGEVETYKRKVSALGLERVVTFIDRVPNGEVARYIANSDICVYPFVHGGGIGCVSLEAMAMGRPLIIGLSNKTAEMVVAERVCVGVKASDPEDIAGALINLLDMTVDEREMMGNKAREYVTLTCSIDYIGQKNVDAINQVLGKNINL